VSLSESIRLSEGSAVVEATQSVELLDVDDPRWLELVSRHTSAGPFHHPSWSVTLSDSYGVRPFALGLAMPGGRLEAGIPIAEVANRFAARRWISLPFTDTCPPLATARTEAVLADAFVSLAHDADVASVAVRAPLGAAGFVTENAGTLHVLSLDTDPEAVLARFHAKIRRDLTKASSGPLVVRRAHDESELTRAFYGLHLRTRRRQGVPVQPRRFFEALWRRVMEPGLGFVLLAYDGTRPVAGAVFLAWNRTVTHKFGASDPEALNLRPNHLLLWEAIRWACERGYHAFDFGRTDPGNDGLHRFKSRWGGKEESLVYSVEGRPARSGFARQSSIAAAVIRKSPLWVCRLAGTALYRYAA
jgi:CelD/BcsL family acetyltransferase involved in cellulose biosynthesis